MESQVHEENYEVLVTLANDVPPGRYAGQLQLYSTAGFSTTVRLAADIRGGSGIDREQLFLDEDFSRRGSASFTRSLGRATRSVHAVTCEDSRIELSWSVTDGNLEIELLRKRRETEGKTLVSTEVVVHFEGGGEAARIPVVGWL